MMMPQGLSQRLTATLHHRLYCHGPRSATDTITSPTTSFISRFRSLTTFKSKSRSSYPNISEILARTRARSSRASNRLTTPRSGPVCAFNYSTTPFNINSNIAKDALIFSHSNDKFFKVISIFGVAQMLMWGYLSLFSAQDLRSGPVHKKQTSDLPWWQKMLYKEGHYKNAISILCFTVGASILFITLTYPRRAIKQLWLLKDGKEVKITSYSWFGKTYTFRAPLEHISCIQSRTGTGSQIPLKVKNKYFFFLLDKQGKFHNPDMFDFVIGLQRNFK